MRSKRMLMGAAVIGCVAATMMSGAYAQEANTTGQFNARSGQPPSTAGQPNALDAPGPKRRCERACQRARERQPCGHERPA